MSTGSSQRDKTLRAFAVYIDLVETVDCLQNWLRYPLALFDLNERGFRLLVLLNRQSPLPVSRIADEFRCTRPNVYPIFEPLERRGWIRRETIWLPPANWPSNRIARARRHLPRRGRRIVLLHLTPLGHKFLARVFPRHAKVSRALMRAISAKDQRSLSRICRKLREGHILKFISEITRRDEWDQHTEAENRGPNEDGVAKFLTPSPQTPREATPQPRTLEMKREMRELLEAIAAKMRQYDVVRQARNTFWRYPPDRERDSREAVERLIRIATERERKLLERMKRTMPPPEIIDHLERMNGNVAHGKEP